MGLDYAAIPVVANIYGLEVTPYDMDGLQVLEHDMLEEQAERQERQERELNGKKLQGLEHGR